MKKKMNQISRAIKFNSNIKLGNNIIPKTVEADDGIPLDEDLDNKFENPHNYQNKIKNPQITHFNKNSFFIYDNYSAKEYLDSIKNKNLIKLNVTEVNHILNFINNINKKEQIYHKNRFIKINKDFYLTLQNFFNIDKKTEPDEIETFLINQFNDLNNRTNFTCRKLSNKYKEMTGKNIGKTKINNILRNRLGLRYRKTTIKTSKINTNKNILISLSFIKIIARAMIQNFSIIYCDETSIQTVNSNLKIWRKENEIITSDFARKARFNLILSVNEKGVLYYEINKENTNENIFLTYMDSLFKKIKEKIIGPYLIVMDNLNIHKTKKLYEFYINNEINIVFNTPYFSDFNSVELTFRNLKQKIYSKIFQTHSEILDFIRDILSDESFNKSILFNFKETCGKYINYYYSKNNLKIETLEYQ